MKTLLTIILLFTFGSFANSQSMTFAHTGITPYDTLTVYAGEDIEFIFGGGGAHPMTEGWQTGETSTPIPFVTQTVTSTIPSVIFTLDTPGTYYFHCATNPGNDVNWGKITVVEHLGVSEETKDDILIYPNPVENELIIKAFSGDATIYDISGNAVLIIDSETTDVSLLPAGIYFVKMEGVKTKFIKK